MCQLFAHSQMTMRIKQFFCETLIVYERKHVGKRMCILPCTGWCGGLRTPEAETISGDHSQLAAEYFGEVVVARLRYAARTALHFRLLGWRLLRLKRKYTCAKVSSMLHIAICSRFREMSLN